MKLHLPKTLRVALLAVVAAGSAAYGSTTYNDLSTKDYFSANEHVYNTGTGKFYLETQSCDLNLTLTLNVNDFASYQSAHDYANGGYYSPFVTWTYNNNAGATYGMADVASGYSGVSYSGVTGYWAGKPWTTATNITLDTLKTYADKDGNVSLTINNTPVGTTSNVVVRAQDNTVLYTVNGLRSQDYVSQHITSFTVNTNYVKSVTLNTDSILDSSSFTPPKDYTVPFISERTDGSTVGRIVFMGDSITHGVEEMSWRWGLFKSMVDNDIENEIVGPLTGYNNATLIDSDFNGDQSSSQYGGKVFENLHYAQASGRTNNMITGSASPSALGGTSRNYNGVTSAKVGKDYNADTYVMLMGTNDILSDGANTQERMDIVTERLLGAGEVQNGAWVNADKLAALTGSPSTDPATAEYTGKWGTMGKIIDDLRMGKDDTMYVMSIPTWAEGRQNIRVYANYVPGYNENLKLWTEAYSATHTGTVKYVDINRGLVDKTLNGTFLGPNDFFRTAGGDYLHPNEQGSLIIAGNLAQGMEIGGRTAGLERSSSHAAGWTSLEPTISLAAGASQQLLSNVFTEDGGYTIDFGAVFGNGATGGWLDRNNALSVSVGDGINTGTLKISEGYISWGDKLLFCQDNSQAGNDPLRIAFHNGNVEQNVAAGYYVWLGDMLIGQGLGSQTGNLLNGVTVNSVGGTSTLTGFSWVNTAYAPTTNFTVGSAPYIVTQKAGNTELVSTAPMLPPMENHNSTATHLEDVSFSGEASASGQYATVGQAASGAISVIRTGTSTDGWIGAVGADHTGNVDVNFHDLQTSSTLILSVVSKSVTDGRVSVVLDGGTVINKDGHFDSSGDHSFLGVYRGNVGGVLQLEVNDATLKSGILMGHASGTGTISGGTKLIVNEGASIGGDVFGGSSSAGSKIQGGTSIAITGGTINGSVYGGNLGGGSITGGTEIVITGGTITGDVVGGNKAGSAGTVEGGTVVTVDGNKALIGGNISGDTVKLKNVANSGASDGFDQYKGTITAANMDLDAYTADAVGATLNVSGTLAAKNSTDTTVSKAATVGTLSVDAGSKLAFDGKLTLTNGLALNKSGASVTFNNGLAVTTGIATNNRYDMVLSNGAEATINCGYTANRLLASCAGTTLNFGENARVTVDGIYNSSTNNNSNGTLNVADGAEVVSNGTVRANTMNLNGSLTVKGTFGANTLNMSGGTLNANADAGITTLKVTGEEKATLSGRTNVTTLTVDGSFLDIAGGTHTITTLQGNDSVAREGVVTIKDDAAVSAETLKVGARGQRYLVEDGSSLAITGNNLKVEAASGDAPAALYTTYGKATGQYTYGAGNGNFVIENAKVTLTDAVTVGNKLVNAEVVADAEGKTVTISNNGNTLANVQTVHGNLIVQNTAQSKDSLKGVSADGGNIDLLNVAATGLSLKELVIGDSLAVTALVNGTAVAADDSNVAKLMVQGELNAASNAVLNANLTMATGSTLKVAEGGLTLGCTLTLQEGINLGDEQLETLHATGALTLFTGVDAITLASADITNSTEAITLAQGIDAGRFFNLATATSVTAPTPSYVIVYSGASNGGVVSLTVVPEPATATLSLLALAALAARRRRH